jgi:hypothetical protein
MLWLLLLVRLMAFKSTTLVCRAAALGTPHKSVVVQEGADVLQLSHVCSILFL